MKILFLRPRMEQGGATRHMQVLAMALHHLGHTVFLGTSSAQRQFDFERQIWLPLFPSTLPHWLASGWLLTQAIRREHIDLIHSHHRFSTLAGRVAARLTGCPLVCTVHEFKQNWRGLAGAWLAPWICVPSAALRAHLIHYYCRSPERIHLIRVGADSNAVSPFDILQLRQNEHLSSGPVVVYVGRLAPEKGVAVFLRALQKVRRTDPTAQPIIVGDGPERAQLEALTRSLGISDWVRFLGYRADAKIWLNVSELVVAPSLAENFSLTVAEAMAAGKPVVASAMGGLPEMVENGVTGWLVPPSEPTALAEAIHNVLADPERARQMGSAAQRQSADWNPVRAAIASEQVYEQARHG